MKITKMADFRETLQIKLVILASLVFCAALSNEHRPGRVCSFSYIVWSLKAEGKSSTSSHV